MAEFKIDEFEEGDLACRREFDGKSGLLCWKITVTGSVSQKPRRE